MRHSLLIFTLIFTILSFNFIFFYKSLDAQCPIAVNPHQHLKVKEEHFLVILILSSFDNIQRRNVLRNAWLQWCKDMEVKYFFVIATKSISQSNKKEINNEQDHFKDLMLLESVEDSYGRLTLKVLQAFVWLEENVKYKFTLKCDDDSFVNVQELIKLLKNYEEDPDHLYLGFFSGHATVQKEGKWKESNWILCDYYLPYALGGGYILSQELTNFIARNAKDLQLFLSEDVSVGVWLASKARVNRVHSPQFNTEFKSRGCSNSYIVSHKHSEVEQKEMFNNLKLTGKMCKKEFQIRRSYNYNWNVPPTKCCQRTNEIPYWLRCPLHFK
ncbi:Hexosyltransferase [Gryllus bimaculatus]|nr:Hexosyltransferase [Gryllus bimaculatus]